MQKLLSLDSVNLTRLEKRHPSWCLTDFENPEFVEIFGKLSVDRNTFGENAPTADARPNRKTGFTTSSRSGSRGF